MPRKPPTAIPVSGATIKKAIITCGAIAGALVAMTAAWHQFGAPTPAWSSDIQILNRRQTDIAIDFYSKAVRDDTILKENVREPSTKALVDQRINEAQDKLKRAQEHKIELDR